MNTGSVNSGSLDGSSTPQWVIRAIVLAAAVATADSSVALRTAYCAVDATATASASSDAVRTALASATGAASAGSIAPAIATYAGAVNASSTAVGYAAVRRDVFATAAGQATATGLALTANAIGDASATMGATVVQADAHIIFWGRSNTTAAATGSAAINGVTRYPTVNATAGSSYTRAEASIKLNGQTYYRLDGFVPGATASATAAINPGAVGVSTTIGCFDFGTATGGATAFVRHPGAGQATGLCAAVPATPVRYAQATLTSAAGASATVTPNKISWRTAAADAAAFGYPSKASTNFAARAAADAGGWNVTAWSVRNTYGAAASGALSDLSASILTGTQHRGVAVTTTASSGSADGLVAYQGWADGFAEAAGESAANVNYAGAAESTATAMVGKAEGFANSEIKAPPDRYMIVVEEDRSMLVPLDDRMMLIAA